MKTYLIGAATCALTLTLSTAAGAVVVTPTYNTGFESPEFTAGTTVPDGPDGNSWVTALNGSTRGAYTNQVAHSGTQSLAISRDTTGADGVINGIRSASLTSGAGEAQSGAIYDTFTSSFWFRTGAYAAGSSHFISMNAWSNDRMSYIAFDYSNDLLSAFAIGIVPETTSGTGFDEYPESAIASGLTVGAWYQVQQTIKFNSGSAVGGDDVVTFLLRDALGNQVGSAITGSWDAGNLGADTYNTGNPRLRPVDQLNFSTRAGDGGVVGYLDDVSFSASLAPSVPEPATWLSMIVGFGAVGGAIRRRRAVAAA